MLEYLCSVLHHSIVGGKAVLFDMKKCPPTLILALGSLRYDTLLWAARIMSLAWCLVHDDCVWVGGSVIEELLDFFESFSHRFCLVAHNSIE